MNVLSLILFIPSLIYDVVLTIINVQNWYDKIDDTIILGALPFPSVASKLLENENVKAVVSLCEDYELWFAYGKEQWKAVDVQFFQLPTANIFEIPSLGNLKQGVQFIKEFDVDVDNDSKNQSKHLIYVHCKGGRTRSATLVICYLMEKYGWDPSRSVEYLRQKRPQVCLLEQHWNVLWKYYTYMHERNDR